MNHAGCHPPTHPPVHRNHRRPSLGVFAALNCRDKKPSLKELEDDVMTLFLDKKLTGAKSDEEFWGNIKELRAKVIEKLERNAHLEKEKAVKGVQMFNIYKNYKRRMRKREWESSRSKKRSEKERNRRC